MLWSICSSPASSWTSLLRPGLIWAKDRLHVIGGGLDQHEGVERVEAMAATLRPRLGDELLFEGEQHGFRRAETQIRTLEAGATRGKSVIVVRSEADGS